MSVPSAQPTQIGFLLVADFALLPYACAAESLRAANVLSGRTLYRWRHLSADGAPVAASNGAAFTPDLRLADAGGLDYLFVCAGGNPSGYTDERLVHHLRRLARMGLPMGGISGGPYVLARAGLLKGYRFTLHWEYAPAFVEEFPDLDLRRSMFEIDRDRLTCSGGTAPMDMLHALIRQRHGPDLALAVSDWFLQTHVREGMWPQRMDPATRLGVRNAHLLRTLTHMERHIDQPLHREALAAVAGVSVRQLERLFRQHLGCTPSQHFLRMRLDRARTLVRQSTMSMIEIAFACGFSCASQFSRAYKSAFGQAPTHDLAAQRANSRSAI